ncbi:MAG: NAD(P)(+) transhydrogenase (Re/Si-specific) subunit beta [Salinivirgaceae bacterium]|nr:NAD(P)(+) transhydrogenase (Re/Si-specific) subunit beta [Salinivirgaceae bacterium]
MNNFILLSFSTANILSDSVYYVLCGILSVAVLVGIHLMSKVERAQLGNQISALAVALGVIITLIKNDILPLWLIYPGVIIGLIIGLILAKRVKMIQMPQLVALLNGVGGAASAIVAAFVFIELYDGVDFFGKVTASLAMAIGSITLFGSLVAAGKLHKVLAQKPVILPFHQTLSMGLLIILLVLIVLGGFFSFATSSIMLVATILIATAFGIVFSIRVGGADMPITISLLNSLSGVEAAVAGFAIGDVLLVSIGGIVGASGLFLTQVMCRAMNRSLMDILLGKTAARSSKTETELTPEVSEESEEQQVMINPEEVIKNAKTAIIVPGYGMALAQAQHLVNNLAKKMKANGATVKYAIHPVAGRMPGHMDVLLVEAGVAFDDVYEMDEVNNEFKDVDVTIVIGANDVLNPAARHAEGTPIYGMPILNVDACKNIVIFNYDLKPGYSGVENPIYKRKSGVAVIQGDAAKTIQELLNKI